jgi:hypothetical protein
MPQNQGMMMPMGQPQSGMDMFGQINNAGLLSRAMKGMQWPGRI